MTGEHVTEQELAVLNKLAEAWNLYLTLPEQNPNDRTEFMYAIHQAQNQVLARSGVRQLDRYFPEWVEGGDLNSKIVQKLKDVCKKIRVVSVR